MSSERSIPLEPLSRLPRKFGRYSLFDFVGRGGMAEIFLARAHTDLGASRLCVVKQILPEFALHPQFADMLIHEAKLAARLNHAHIVQVFDLGREGDQLYIAMEYVEGFDLNALLRRCSQKKIPLPLEYALRIVSDTLQGLDYAHRRATDDGKPLGIVHRDVSPSNVLVSLEGEVKVCDFGIARANDIVLNESGAQMDEAIKGKAGYMSPEHARGEPIDARADVFAVGIVLWELIAGRRMYRKESEISLLDQAKAANIPELPPKGLPHEEKLHAIVKKALAPSRNDRYPSAGAMLRDVDSFMSEAKFVASPLKLGEWLLESFGTDVAEQRKARDRLTPLPMSSSAPPPPVAHAQPSSPPGPITAPMTEAITAPMTGTSTGPITGDIISKPPSGPPSPISPVAASVSVPAAMPSVPRVVDPDPPSLPASTVDVVPSSSLRRQRASEPGRASKAMVSIVVGIILAIAVVVAALVRH